MNNSLIIFFDGVCNLCNGFVDFLIKRNKQNLFKFASLQGSTAKSYLDESTLNELKTVVVYYDGKILKKSDAILIIFKKLGPFWCLLYLFKPIPRFLRDLIYDFIAQNRYRLFGKKDTCRLPTEQEKSYFLD